MCSCHKYPITSGEVQTKLSRRLKLGNKINQMRKYYFSGVN